MSPELCDIFMRYQTDVIEAVREKGKKMSQKHCEEKKIKKLGKFMRSDKKNLLCSNRKTSRMLLFYHQYII